MARTTATATEGRAPLTRERVLEAAIALADAKGIESLSMRKLARALGVEAMSLYHHVASKDELLAGALDIVLGEVDLPEQGTEWKAAIRRTATSANQVLFAHRWAANLTLSGPSLSQGRLRYMDAILRVLREAGFRGALADHAYHAIDGYIMGFTLWEVAISTGMARLQTSVSVFLEQFETEGYPDLAEHLRWHLGPGAEGSDEFVFGLELLLDGLERRRLAI